MTNTSPKYQLLAGNLPNEYVNATSVSSLVVTANPNEIFSISDDSTFDAMKIPEWQQGVVYSSYGNSLGESYKTLVRYGSYVYLCGSNNLKNLTNQYNSSTYVPQDSAILTDGYYWIKYFEWDSSKTSGEYTKIPSFTNLEIELDKRESTSFCTTNNIGLTGYCTFYSRGTGLTVNTVAGITLSSMITTCDVCSAVSSILSHDGYYLTFDTVAPVDVLTIRSRMAKLNELKLDTTVSFTNFAIKASIVAENSGITAGSIVGLFLNKDFPGTTNAISPTTATFGFSGASGSGASGSFLFAAGSIVGISLDSYGASYSSDTELVIYGITSGSQQTAIKAAITIVLPLDPYSSLSGISSLFDTKAQFSLEVVNLTNVKLKAYSGPGGVVYNYYALLQNSENGSLPITISGVKHLPPNTGQNSDQGIYYNINFINT